MVINPTLRELRLHIDCACQTDNMVESVEPSPAKRPRNPNFTPAECAIIFEDKEENLGIIKRKFSSTLSNKNKSCIWEVLSFHTLLHFAQAALGSVEVDMCLAKVQRKMKNFLLKMASNKAHIEL